MFLKQYNYKPRTASGSAGSDDSSSQKAAADNSNAAPQQQNVSSAIAGRRRSSASSGQFAGLEGYKRKSLDHSDRKAAIADQHTVQPGVLGQVWNNFTKGQGK